MMRKLLTAHKASRIRSTLPSQVAPTSPMFPKRSRGGLNPNSLNPTSPSLNPKP